jgi:hypothetical protein
VTSDACRHLQELAGLFLVRVHAAVTVSDEGVDHRRRAVQWLPAVEELEWGIGLPFHNVRWCVAWS